jgi:tripeptidyl-peptidase-1
MNVQYSIVYHVLLTLKPSFMCLAENNYTVVEMLSLSPSLLPILLIVRLVLSQTSVLKLHEAVTAVPDGWTYVGPANDSIIVNLSIALKQPGLDGLRARLDAISNPNHQDFGAHLSKDQLLLFQQPQLSSINSVSNWLESHDIDNFQHKGAWIYFNATVQSVNSLLRCHLARYADSKSQIVYRAHNYSLPIDLSKDIDFVFPVTQLIRQPKHGVISSAEVHQAVQRRQTECKY